jgi:heat-inducible transcriptional repressor
MDLDDRKNRILKAIVEEYVTNVEPVGSKTIANNIEIGLSSATIRNEMAELEDKGYLEQPHTSAGRIPSDKGYRYYVDQIMKYDEEVLNNNTIDIAKQINEGHVDEINGIIKHTLSILSDLTNYTAVAVAPKVKVSRINEIKLINVDNNRILVVLVTNSGLIKDFIIKTQRPFDDNEIVILNNILNVNLDGITIETIGNKDFSNLNNEFNGYIFFINKVIDEIINTLNSFEQQVYTEGIKNILNFPEFSDISKAKSFLELMETQDFIKDYLLDDCNDINIIIGSENKHKSAQNLSIVTCSYDVGSNIKGTIGIVGPTRMNYSKSVSSIKYIKNLLDNIFNK